MTVVMAALGTLISEERNETNRRNVHASQGEDRLNVASVGEEGWNEADQGSV